MASQTIATSSTGQIYQYSGSVWSLVLSGGYAAVNNSYSGASAIHMATAQTQGYGFSIPSNATINGIEVSFSTRSNIGGGSFGNNQPFQASIDIATTSFTGTAKSYDFPINGGYTTYTFGSPTDLWGTTWTPANINSADFGVIMAHRASQAVFELNDGRFTNVTVYYTLKQTISHTVDTNLLYTPIVVTDQVYDGTIFYGGWGGIGPGFAIGASTPDVMSQRFNLTSSVDTLIKNTYTKSYSVDTLLRARLTKTPTVDTLLRARLTKTPTVDTLLKARLIKTPTVDTLLESRYTKNYSVDTLLKATISATHSVDTILLIQSPTKFNTVDTLLLKRTNVSSTVDTLLSQRYSLSDSIDTFLKKRYTAYSTVDILLSARVSLSQSLDTILRKVTTRSHTIDTVVKSGGIRVYTVDTLLSRRATKNHSIDTCLLARISKNHSIDTFLKIQTGKARGSISVNKSRGYISIVTPGVQSDVQVPYGRPTIVKPRVSVGRNRPRRIQ